MSTNGKAKSARKKLLPAIPAGVEPAVSPHMARPNLALASFTHSPLLPRSPNISTHINKSQVSSKPKDKQRPSNEGEDSAVTVAVRVRPFSKR